MKDEFSSPQGPPSSPQGLPSRLAELLTPKSGSGQGAAEQGAFSQGAAAQDAFTQDAFTQATLAEDPLAQVLAATNPLLSAARPLLRALAEIPELTHTGKSGEAPDLEKLRQTLVRDTHQFQFLCDRAGFRREQVVTARYCLCTALDEAIYKLPGAGGHWADHSLLLLFHNETSGGEKFFLLLGHMVQSPREHIQVLELLYHILSLGFEGRYALMIDGTRQLEAIHRRLLAVISEQTEPVQPELSPHWRGLAGGRLRFMRTVPVWVTVCVLSLLLLALYTSRRAELVPQSEALATKIQALAQVEAPAVAWSKELPLELWFTVQDQQRFGLSLHPVDGVPSQMLRIPGGVAFVNGTDLHPNMLAVLDILAERLKVSTRTALVVGHTDNTRLRFGSRFRDNQHLSEARAETVVQQLVQRGVDPLRLRPSGKSDSEPLASNASQKGKALNRRVEVALQPEVRP